VSGQPVATPGERFPSSRPRWGFGDVAVTLLGTIVLAGLTAGVLAGLESGPWSSPTAKAWSSVVGLVVPWLVLGGWPVLAARLKGNGPVVDYRLRLRWVHVPVAVGLGLLGLVTAAGVAAAQVKITGHPIDSAVGDVAASTTAASHAALVVLALCTVLGAPVVEELAFRGLTYGAFLGVGQTKVWSAVWTTVLFALFHFEPVRLGVLLVLGAALAVTRVATDSTGASIVAHMTINAFGAVDLLTHH
jgi:membrane protease YdiL (CAAX protease family)